MHQITLDRQGAEGRECLLRWCTVSLSVLEEKRKDREGNRKFKEWGKDNVLETTPCQLSIVFWQLWPKADGTWTDDESLNAEWERDEEKMRGRNLFPQNWKNVFILGWWQKRDATQRQRELLMKNTKMRMAANVTYRVCWKELYCIFSKYCTTTKWQDTAHSPWGNAGLIVKEHHIISQQNCQVSQTMTSSDSGANRATAELW